MKEPIDKMAKKIIKESKYDSNEKIIEKSSKLTDNSIKNDDIKTNTSNNLNKASYFKFINYNGIDIENNDIKTNTSNNQNNLLFKILDSYMGVYKKIYYAYNDNIHWGEESSKFLTVYLGILYFILLWMISFFGNHPEAKNFVLIIFSMLSIIWICIYVCLVEWTDITGINTHNSYFEALTGGMGIILLISLIIGGLILIFSIC